jgi:hypothetical protein
MRHVKDDPEFHIFRPESIKSDSLLLWLHQLMILSCFSALPGKQVDYLPD